MLRILLKAFLISLILFFTGQLGRSSNARVERAHSYRARSASKRTTKLPILPLRSHLYIQQLNFSMEMASFDF